MAGTPLGERLRMLREERGLTLDDAARHIGTVRTTYHGYESGRRKPDHETIARLARLYGTSTDYLLGLTDDPRPPDETKQDEPAPTLEDLRRMAKMIEAAGGHIDAAMARVIREILEAANRGKKLTSGEREEDKQRGEG